MPRERPDRTVPRRRGARCTCALVCAGFLASAVAAAVPRVATPPPPPAIVALPQLSVAPPGPGYALDAGCSAGGGAVTFHLTVSNTGAGASAAIPREQGGVVVATELRGGDRARTLWEATAALPPIPAHGSIPLDVTLMPPAARAEMAGGHEFRVTVNAQGGIRTASPGGNATTITVTIPTGFCEAASVESLHRSMVPPSLPPVLTPGSTMAATNTGAGAVGAGTLPAQPPPPGSGIGARRPAGVQLPPAVAPPADLRYTNSPAVCTAHAGTVLASLVCPALLSGKSAPPLVWDWQPCGTPGCVSKPDGFRIYRVTETVITHTTIRLGTRTLVDTQTDPAMTVRGVSPYHDTDCYVVTAYKGSTESADSNRWCGAPNLAMGTAVVTVSPASTVTTQGLVTPIGGCDPGYTPYVRNNGEGIERYDTGDCGVDWVYHTFYLWDLSSAVPKDKAIAKVLFVAYSSVQQLTEGKSSVPCAITGVDQIDWMGETLTQVSLQSLPVVYRPQTHIDVKVNRNGVLADLTPWFTASRSIAMGWEHTPDDFVNVHDTCLALFHDPHLDVTYYP